LSAWSKNPPQAEPALEQTMATATKQPPIQTANSSSVRVEIFDQGYNLRGTDPEYILKLAEYVDSKMRAVAEQTHTVDSARLAVLAALNIADEYHLLKRKAEGGSSDSSQRTRQLLNALDEVLTDGRRAG
jgi:cell division protein ZapA